MLFPFLLSFHFSHTPSLRLSLSLSLSYPSQVTTKNCNHFSDALCKTLVGTSIPAWVNRPAKIGSVFSFGVFGGGSKKGKEGGKEGGKEWGGGMSKAEKAAAGKKKELTEEQKARLEAIKKTTGGR